MTFSRRDFLQTASTAALAFGAVSLCGPAMAADETVDLDKLLEPGPLGDKVLGAEDAPVTIVEYASLTCSHCAAFHAKTYPELKSQYIDTGKVRFIMREYPLDAVASAGFMLARCAPEEKYFDIVDVMFAEQRTWAFTENPYNSLLNFSKQLGFTQESFESCLTDQSLLDAVNGVRERGSAEFGVSATPTFFINGEKHSGALSIEELGKIIEDKL